MHKSFISVSIAGLLMIATVILAFTLGASLNQPRTSSSLILTQNEVRLERARQTQKQDGEQDVEGTVSGVFVYQGVLADALGTPISNPVELTFTLYSFHQVQFTHSMTEEVVTPDQFGRFQIDIPLSSPEFMSSFENLMLEIKETGTLEVITIVPIQYTPRAWYSQRAIFSNESAFADEASFSLFAENAEHAFSSNSANHADTAGSALVASSANSAINAQHADYADVAIQLAFDQSATPTIMLPFFNNPGSEFKATRVGNIVHLSGNVQTTMNTNELIQLVSLPSGFRPSATRNLIAGAFNAANNPDITPVRIQIMPNGQVFVGDDLEVFEDLFLDGLSYVID